MTTQTPEAPGAPAGTEGTPQAGDASTTPEPTANGAGSQDAPDTGSTTTEPAGRQPAADDTPKVIQAIRDDFKAERQRRQKAEQEFAQFKAASEQRETERQQAEADRNKRLAVALGVASEDEPPDPAKLAEELERSREQHKAELERQAAEIRQRDLRLAVLTQAPSLDANGSLLMDSMSFLRKIDGLDPSAEDFAERLGEQIKAAAEGNPQYKLASAPAPEAPKPPPSVPRNGGEHNGAPGGNRQLNLADVEAMTPQEVAQAQDAGLLIDLGFAPRKKRF